MSAKVAVRIRSSVHASFPTESEQTLVAVAAQRYDSPSEPPRLVFLLVDEWPEPGEVIEVEIVNYDPVSLLCG